MKIVVAGANGLIGKKLIFRLLLEGHDVVALARSPESLPELPSANIFKWSAQDQPPARIFENCDAVVNLAGAGIADVRWTPSRKKQIWDSRIVGTKNLVSTLKSMGSENRPKVFINASAIGFYQDGSSQQDETSANGSGFLAELCYNWENSALEAEAANVRTVIMRTGLVLSNQGGVLEKSGSKILGSGQQWMSWIHIDDVVNFIIFAIQNQNLRGPFNLTAPQAVQNRQFAKTVAAVFNAPLVLPVPAFAIKAALGELSSAVLSNQNIYPKKTLESGFQFKFSRLEESLKDLGDGTTLTESTFSARQFVPLSRKTVFSFFAKAENLEALTPPWLNFHIVKKSTPEIQQGSIIDYKLKIHQIPVTWRTLISEWKPDNHFVDDQLKGPYSKWHHVHSFHEVRGGTLICDDVTFKVPGWCFGRLLLPLIKKDVQQIFNYRQKKIVELVKQGGLK